MPILNISYARIKDIDKFKQYVAKAAVLMQEFNVEVVLRGEYTETLQGENSRPHITAVFRYQNREAVDGFYQSEPYKQLIPLRDEACEMTIRLYEELS